MQKITTFLWFDEEAEQAAEHYVSVFASRPGGGSGDGSAVEEVSRYGEAGPGTPGSAMTVSFRLEGQGFLALNGGPGHPFSDAISLLVHCRDQEEVDHFWKHLADGGEEGPCGWVKDRYGLSWQIVPDELTQLIQDPDPARANRAMRAMLAMGKIEIAELRRAADAA
jgi:predicted 3-demethylubiquinone-9 3-methyltransferase (glyoxalase superfamily)